jgi:hypothetical protein
MKLPNRHVEDLEDGCGKGCAATIILMWLAIVGLGIFGAASCANMFSRQ